MIKIRPYQKKGRAIHKDKWEVDIVVRLPSGEVKRERVKSPVTSKSGALRWAQEREGRLLEEGIRPKAPPTASPDASAVSTASTTPTLTEFVPRFIEGYAKANREKPSSIASKEAICRSYLEPKLGEKRLDAIRDEDVQQLKGGLKHLAPKTVNNILTVLNTMLRVAAEWNVIQHRPKVRLVKAPRTEIAFYELDEFERLVAAAKLVDERVELMILLGGEAGLRCGEIMALEWSDIDTKRGVLKVQRSEWIGQVTVPKGGRTRQVGMTTRLAQVLAQHRHLKGPRVLCRDGGNRVTRSVLSAWMERAQRRANLKVTGGLHILRHTFCSRLAMLGASTMAIKELAGHSDIGTTQRYMHLSPAAKAEAIGLLDGQGAGGEKKTKSMET